MALEVICPVCGSTFKTYPSVGQKFCSMKCRNASYVGRKASAITRARMSAAKAGKVPAHHFRPGADHPFWNKHRQAIPFVETPEYKALRLRVLSRDDYTCRLCGARGHAGVRPVLHVHHVRSRAAYPELALEESNCVTTCLSCHKQTASYLDRWQAPKRYADYVGVDEASIRKTREKANG